MNSLNDTLESLIDTHGLTHVLNAIAVVCSEKAEHLRTNWQDSAAAKDWDADAAKIEKTAYVIRNA